MSQNLEMRHDESELQFYSTTWLFLSDVVDFWYVELC